jgi:ribosome biogenesis protein BRX1
MRKLLPHHKKDVKLDEKDNISNLNEICELKSCNNCLYFEVRKKVDCYLWLSKAPNGPSAKFLLTNGIVILWIRVDTIH